MIKHSFITSRNTETILNHEKLIVPTTSIELNLWDARKSHLTRSLTNAINNVKMTF